VKSLFIKTTVRERFWQTHFFGSSEFGKFKMWCFHRSYEQVTALIS